MNNIIRMLFCFFILVAAIIIFSGNYLSSNNICSLAFPKIVTPLEKSSSDIPLKPLIFPDEIAKTPLNLTKNAESLTMRKQLKVQGNGKKELSVYNSDFSISECLKEEMTSLEAKYSNVNFGFYAISLKDYTCIGYNEDVDIFTASSIKAPYLLFVCKELERGTRSLDDTIEYTKDLYNDGSGVVKKSKFGTRFTIDTLLYNTIHWSDNIAYLMLQKEFGHQGYGEMISELGCKVWLNGYTKWGYLKPEELAIIWNEIYNYSYESEYGYKLLELLINAEYNFTKDTLGHYEKVAHKSGFNPDAYNDCAIVFGNSNIDLSINSPDDYIVAVMTSPGNSKACFKDLVNLIDKVMIDLKTFNSEIIIPQYNWGIFISAYKALIQADA